MADIGFKVSKLGAATSSSDIDDYVYWSKYPGLTLIDKVSGTVTVNGSSYVGTQSIAHGFNFIPLTVAVINHTDNGYKYQMPVQEWTATISCPLDDLGEFTTPKPSFSYKVNSTNVDIIYSVKCYTQIQGGGGPFAPTSTETFIIDLYYYMWKLGSSFSV